MIEQIKDELYRSLLKDSVDSADDIALVKARTGDGYGNSNIVSFFVFINSSVRPIYEIIFFKENNELSEITSKYLTNIIINQDIGYVRAYKD